MMFLKKLLACVLVPIAVATESSTHLRNQERRLQNNPCSSGPPPPDVQKSTVVELSYFDEGEDIYIEVDDGVTDLYFKFSACPGGTEFTFDTCDNPPLPDLGLIHDTYMTLWTRDQLNFVEQECYDNKVFDAQAFTCLWQERITVDSEYFNEELFLKVSLVQREAGGFLVPSPNLFQTSGEFKFKYSVEDLGTAEWPCRPDSVTADYVKGSAKVDFDDSVTDNIILDFKFSGQLPTTNFGAVVYSDPDCTFGNEVASSEGGYDDPPFDFILDDAADPPHTSTLEKSLGTVNRVKLEANYDNWVAPFWTEDGGFGTLEMCVQFQVNNTAPDTEEELEFVDVRLFVSVDLAQTADKFGEVILIRDSIIDTGEIEVTPNIPVKVGPCEWPEGEDEPLTTVTQGENFPVCVWFENEQAGRCITSIDELRFTVEADLPEFPEMTYQVIPEGQLLNGPVECLYTADRRLQLESGEHQCSVRILPPAALIRQLEAGNVDSSRTGYLSGIVSIGFGDSCQQPSGRMLEDGGIQKIDFLGQMEFDLAPLAADSDICGSGLASRLGFICRIKTLLQNLRLRRNN